MLPTVIVIVEEPPAVTEVGLKVTVVPAGWPLALRLTGCAPPLVTAVEMVERPLPPCATLRLLGPAAIEKSEVADAMPQRNRLPRERESLTHKFSIAGHEGYITAGKYEDGSLGEIFLTDIGKDGSTLRGMMNAFATAISIGLQYGVPLETFVRKFSYMRFDPEGMTTNPEIPFAKSLPDYIMRWLASRFLDPSVHEELGIMSEEVRAKKMAEEASGPGPGNGGNGHANGHSDSDSEAKPAAAALTDTPPVVPAKIEGLDLGPACSQCGGMMQRTGSCYTCSSCGNNTGCG